MWKLPILGETRVRTPFAIFPTALSCGHAIWLERYVVEERYMRTRSGSGWCPIVRSLGYATKLNKE